MHECMHAHTYTHHHYQFHHFDLDHVSVYHHLHTYIFKCIFNGTTQDAEPGSLVCSVLKSACALMQPHLLCVEICMCLNAASFALC